MKAKVLAIGCAALMLTGCTSFTQSPLTPEDQFVVEVQNQVTGASSEPQRDLIAAGVAICKALGGGEGAEHLHDRLVESSSFTARELDVIIDASQKYLCPDDE